MGVTSLRQTKNKLSKRTYPSIKVQINDTFMLKFALIVFPLHDFS